MTLSFILCYLHRKSDKWSILRTEEKLFQNNIKQLVVDNVVAWVFQPKQDTVDKQHCHVFWASTLCDSKGGEKCIEGELRKISIMRSKDSMTSPYNMLERKFLTKFFSLQREFNGNSWKNSRKENTLHRFNKYLKSRLSFDSWKVARNIKKCILSVKKCGRGQNFTFFVILNRMGFED